MFGAKRLGMYERGYSIEVVEMVVGDNDAVDFPMVNAGFKELMGYGAGAINEERFFFMGEEKRSVVSVFSRDTRRCAEKDESGHCLVWKHDECIVCPGGLLRPVGDSPEFVVLFLNFPLTHRHSPLQGPGSGSMG